MTPVTPIYEFRLAGRLSPQLAAVFDGMQAQPEPGATRLRGPIPNTATLDAIIDRIEALGLQLVEFHRLPSRHADAD